MDVDDEEGYMEVVIQGKTCKSQVALTVLAVPAALTALTTVDVYVDDICLQIGNVPFMSYHFQVTFFVATLFRPHTWIITDSGYRYGLTMSLPF